MCRMAVYGGMGEFKPLVRGLDQLERSMGGDGNGFYMTESDEYVRGTGLCTGEIAFDSYQSEMPTMFHTRYATVGGARSELNHPFNIGSGVLMHNGHWSYYYDYNRDERSDTATAATLVSKYGPGVLLDEDFEGSGVWVVYDAGEVLVIPRGWRDFLFQWPKSGGYFHASELIHGIEMERTQEIVQGEVYRINDDGSVDTIELEKVDIPDHEFQPKPKINIKPKKKKNRKKKAKGKNRTAGTTKFKNTKTGEPFGATKGSEDTDVVLYSSKDDSWDRWAWLAIEEAEEAEERAAEEQKAWEALAAYEENALTEVDAKMGYAEDFFEGIPTTDFNS